MQVQCNGQTIHIDYHTTIAQLLDQLDITNVAIALNQQIIHRRLWPSTLLRDGDLIDIFQATVGG